MKKVIAAILVVFLSLTGINMAYAYDVPKGKWYTEAAEFASSDRIMSWISGDFAAGERVTRWQVAESLYSMVGRPEEKYSNIYPDVSDTDSYAQAVQWANKAGVITGYSNGKMGPNDYITRQDFSLILYRMAKLLGIDTSITDNMVTITSTKSDYAKVSNYAKTAVMWAAGNEFIGKNSDINPKNNITRAELAAMIMRYMKAFGIQKDYNEFVELEEKLGEYLADIDQRLHISIDDCNSILKELNSNDYSSIFDQKYLAFFKRMHDLYGMKITLYVYYSDKNSTFTLEDMTDRYKMEFVANSDWLRFGFHAYDENSYQELTVENELTYYNNTVNDIIRFTGSDKCLDRFVRLDRFYASTEMIKALKETTNGITGLYTPDDKNRLVFGFDKAVMNIINSKGRYTDANGVLYIPTDFRLENLTDKADLFEKLYAQAGDEMITPFTHEWKLGDSTIISYIETICRFACYHNIRFDFCK